MLGALLATLFGGGREMGLLRFPPKVVHDPRIHDGKIALCARVEGEEQARRAIEAMRGAGGTDVRAEEGEL
jgi:Cdc6-like AAA superfamily ATPase